VDLPSPSYLGYRFGASVANAVPEAIGTPVAETAARVAAVLAPGRRRIVKRNLRRATDGTLEGLALERAVSDPFASYGRYWLELFRLPSHGDVEDRITETGWEHIETALAAGHGVILALPHLGGFDSAAAWLTGRGHPPVVVVEAVEPPELFEWFAEVRRAIGMDVIPLGPGAAAAVAKALAANRIVCLLADRDLAGDGLEVEFFGERTTLPGGPATLALRSGAALIPTGVYFRPHGRNHLRIGPPIPTERHGRLREDVTRITQELAHRFEELVRVAPQQWHVMQPNWPSDRDEPPLAGPAPTAEPG
jgi:phosphatidylinositol dimannoside acyltransferase